MASASTLTLPAIDLSITAMAVLHALRRTIGGDLCNGLSDSRCRQREWQTGLFVQESDEQG
jgi:hypothetical protein